MAWRADFQSKAMDPRAPDAATGTCTRRTPRHRVSRHASPPFVLAVHRDVPPAGREPGREPLGEGLEAAVPVRNAARAEDVQAPGRDRACGTGPAYLAPRPRMTAGTVRTAIFRSSHSDQLSMYSRSSFIHSSKRQVVAAADLPQAREARRHRQAAALPRLVLPHFLDHGGPRADEAHVALEDVPELRQLVEARAAQPPADRRDPRVVGHLERRARPSRCTRASCGFSVSASTLHRAELQEDERASVQAAAHLPEQHRPGRRQLHERRQDRRTAGSSSDEQERRRAPASTHRRTNSSTSSRGAVLKVSSGSPEKSSNDRFDTVRGRKLTHDAA